MPALGIFSPGQASGVARVEAGACSKIIGELGHVGVDIPRGVVQLRQAHC